MIGQVKQMMGVGLRFEMGMLGNMKLVRAVLGFMKLALVIIVLVMLVPLKVAANTTVIINDEQLLRFAQGFVNAWSFEGELNDFTLAIDGQYILTGAYLMIYREMEVTIERIIGRNLDFSIINNADVSDGEFTISELLVVDEALFYGPSLFCIEGIKARAGDTNIMV